MGRHLDDRLRLERGRPCEQEVTDGAQAVQVALNDRAVCFIGAALGAAACAEGLELVSPGAVSILVPIALTVRQAALRGRDAQGARCLGKQSDILAFGVVLYHHVDRQEGVSRERALVSDSAMLRARPGSPRRVVEGVPQVLAPVYLHRVYRVYRNRSACRSCRSRCVARAVSVTWSAGRARS